MKTKMHGTFLLLIVFLIVIIFFSACKDDIFFLISKEVEIKDPKIQGSPTNIVEFNGRVYVASGRNLWSYGEGGWGVETPQSDKRIGNIAATKDYLYAIFYDDEKTEIRKKDALGEWSPNKIDTNIIDTSLYTIIQNIYQANDEIYIGAQNPNNNEHAVFVLDSGNNIELRIPGVERSPLRGVCSVGADVFVCAGGLIYINGDIVGNSDLNFNGIITLPDGTVAATTRQGALYKVEKAKFIEDPENPGEQIEQVSSVILITSFAEVDDERYTTGTIAVWQNKESPPDYLLLVGKTEYEYSTSTGHTYGYMELKLNSTGGFEDNEKFKEPGKFGITTVDDYESYSSSMGAIPINSLFQVPFAIDEYMPVFASTQKDGLWSCRPIDTGVYRWNAET